jgi:hypothetical protein
MLYYTDFIIYLWLVPVFFLLFLPLAITAVSIPLSLTRRVFFKEKTIKKEKRKHPRFFSCKDTFAKITVGDMTCTALVSDISQMGISLKHLPDMFSYKINKLSVVIKQYGIDYNLMVKTKWVTLTKSGKQIGAEIETASPEWNQFLLQTAKTSQLEQV